MKITHNEFKYSKPLKSNNLITITIGNGQKGSITLIHVDEEITHEIGKIKDQPIGSNEKLAGKFIIISAVITDHREDTDTCTLLIEINGEIFQILIDSADTKDHLLSFQTVIEF